MSISELRRKERAISSRQALESLLERAPVGRLALVTAQGPYAVALNFLFWEGAIYFHGSPGGRKMAALQADPRVCFLVDEAGAQMISQQACGISQIYTSVVCFGKAEPVESPSEKKRVLEKMIAKYVPAGYPIPPMTDDNIRKTAVVRIVIETLSGKENRPSPMHTVLPQSLLRHNSAPGCAGPNHGCGDHAGLDRAGGQAPLD